MGRLSSSQLAEVVTQLTAARHTLTADDYLRSERVRLRDVIVALEREVTIRETGEQRAKDAA